MDDILKKKNIIIFFFMNGCPYCEETKPAWEELKNHHKYIEFIEIEKDQIPPKMSEELQINGFPHFVKIDKKGKKKAVSGSKTTLDKLSTALFGKSGGRSRRFRRIVRKTLRHSRS